MLWFFNSCCENFGTFSSNSSFVLCMLGSVDFTGAFLKYLSLIPDWHVLQIFKAEAHKFIQMTWVHSCSTQKIFARLMIPKLFVNLIWHNNYLFILFQLIIIMAETYTRIITISIASSVVIWHCEIDNLGMISAMTQLSIKSNIMFSGHLI